MWAHHCWVMSPDLSGNYSHPLMQKKRCENLKFRHEKNYICRQNISTYRWTQIFVTFLSSRVPKKNLFNRSRIKFCLTRTIIMNKTKTQKSLEAKRTNKYRSTWWILCCNRGCHSIYQVTSSQSGLTSKFFWYLSIK